ncbi:MAG TPA: hypothetical protein VFV99_05165 [Kofleriaceae bacterium]|nr:hypothetical protein [Kofleriaceae bacterium]
MMRLAAAMVVLVGCAPSERECIDLRADLDGPHGAGMPRRYWDYTDHRASDRDSAELAAAVVGCKQSDRERDCTEVRRILARPFATPPSGDTGIWDPSPFEQLRKMHFRDDEVWEAALEYTKDAGWTYYTPYSTEAETSNSRSRLAKLCGLQTITVSVDSPR